MTLPFKNFYYMCIPVCTGAIRAIKPQTQASVEDRQVLQVAISMTLYLDRSKGLARLNYKLEHSQLSGENSSCMIGILKG